MGRRALALPTFSWATCSGPPGLPPPPHRRTHVSASGVSLCPTSLLSQHSTSCFPPRPGFTSSGLCQHTQPLRPLTHPAPGTCHPHQPGFGPQGSGTPGLPVQRLLLPSQRPTGLCLRLQHPAWPVLFPQPRSSSCSLPVVLLAVGLLRVGGLLSPWPLFSILRQLPAKYPWGLVREGFLLNFFPGEIISPLVNGFLRSAL